VGSSGRDVLLLETGNYQRYRYQCHGTAVRPLFLLLRTAADLAMHPGKRREETKMR